MCSKFYFTHETFPQASRGVQAGLFVEETEDAESKHIFSTLEYSPKTNIEQLIELKLQQAVEHSCLLAIVLFIHLVTVFLSDFTLHEQ